VEGSCEVRVKNGGSAWLNNLEAFSETKDTKYLQIKRRGVNIRKKDRKFRSPVCYAVESECADKLLGLSQDRGSSSHVNALITTV
jgi:hypothetical protein